MSFVDWIQNEPYTAGLVLLLAVLVILVIRKLIRDRRAGKHNCGGNCGSCPMSKGCGEKKSGNTMK